MLSFVCVLKIPLFSIKNPQCFNVVSYSFCEWGLQVFTVMLLLLLCFIKLWLLKLSKVNLFWCSFNQLTYSNLTCDISRNIADYFVQCY